VWQFVKQYEYIQETRLDREDNAGYIDEGTTAPVWSRYDVQAASNMYLSLYAF
jgi:hypothetical protein